MTIAFPQYVGLVTPTRGKATTVTVAGTAVRVADLEALGGYIINSANNTELLYVDPTKPADTVASDTTVSLIPGASYVIQPNALHGIWVNSRQAGHNFICVVLLPATPPEYTPIYGPFPPLVPQSLKRPIYSYLYQEYSDDDDLQGFVAAYNGMQQDVIDTFNGLNLPIYQKKPVYGALLDWVAAGVYGITRPSLSSGKFITEGPYNTDAYNTANYNHWDLVYPDAVSFVDDDNFRRIITWHVSKREGKYFSIEWLKKRIMKFLIGVDGTQPVVDQTYQISITFGPNYEVTIRFILGIRTITNDTEYNYNNYNTMEYGRLDSTYESLAPLPNMEMFREALISGVLELPFQFTYDVVIG